MNLAIPLSNPPAELVRLLVLRINAVAGDGYWHKPGWRSRAVRSDAMMRAFRRPRAEFAAAVADAESLGWIRAGADASGREVLAVDPLAVGLFGLADPGRRDPPAQDQLDGLPHGGLLSALATFRCSAPSVARVASHLGWPVEAAWDVVQQAEQAGLVESWPDHPVEPTAGLSAFVAGRLGLRLSRDGSRWLAPGEPDETLVEADPGFRCEAEVGGDDGPGLYDLVVDPKSPDGLAWAEAGERAQQALDRLDTEWEAAEIERRVRDGKAWGVTEAEARKDVREDAREKLPRVSTVLGLRLVWPVRWTPGDGPCPACGGEPMGVVACCVICDAAGLDRAFARVGHHEDVATLTGRVEILPVASGSPADRRAGLGKVG